MEAEEPSLHVPWLWGPGFKSHICGLLAVTSVRLPLATHHCGWSGGSSKFHRASVLVPVGAVGLSGMPFFTKMLCSVSPVPSQAAPASGLVAPSAPCENHPRTAARAAVCRQVRWAP